MADDVPLYTPCLNGRTFMGMVRVMGSAEGPQWGGTGNYVRESDHIAQAMLLSRITKLQEALWFWIPRSMAPPEVARRIVDDLLLLIGMDGEPPDGAEARGWIRLNPQD